MPYTSPGSRGAPLVVSKGVRGVQRGLRGEIEIPPDPSGPSAARPRWKNEILFKACKVALHIDFILIAFSNRHALRWAQRADWGALSPLAALWNPAHPPWRCSKL